METSGSKVAENPHGAVHRIGDLVDHQVLQRDRASNDVTIELTRGRGTTVVLPAGGPYDLATEEGEVVVRDLLVGDLWILAGQSNMAGQALMRDVEVPSPAVHLFDMARRWRPAAEPLHRLSTSPDPAHRGWSAWEQEQRRAYDDAGLLGAGPGLPFGRAYHGETGVPVGLIATAQGASTLAEWSPTLADAGGGSLYGSLLLSLRGAGGRVAGVLWYQGESEALDRVPATFREDLAALRQAIRSDAGDERLPFIHVQLGRCAVNLSDDGDERWSRVREWQREFDASGMAATVDLALEDGLHLSALSQKRLGQRLARLAAGSAETLCVRSMRVESDQRHVVVTYGGVTGRLAQTGGVVGFSIHDRDGRRSAKALHAAITADGHAVRIRLGEPVGAGDQLAYGFGMNPTVFLHDSEDMSVPAFGPVRLT